MGYRATQLGRLAISILVVSVALSFISGLGLWYIHEQREKLADLPAWTAACRSLHGILNPVLCVFFGFMVAHMAGGWKMRANRKTGVSVAVSFALLILTGAGLYYSVYLHFYFTIHLIAGLLLPVLLGVHWMRARRWVAEAGAATKAQNRAKE